MRTGGYVQRMATLTTSQQSLSYLHVDEHIDMQCTEDI